MDKRFSATLQQSRLQSSLTAAGDVTHKLPVTAGPRVGRSSARATS